MGGKGSGRRSSPSRFDGTNYSRAWKSYKMTESYGRVRSLLESKGMQQPLIDNWIRSVFEAGWTASGVKIELIPRTNS